MRYEDIIPFYQKLNYRCPKGKYVSDSYKCGNTPEEAKANYETEQKIKAEKQKGVDDRRGKRAERISGKAEKRISTIKDPILLEKVTNVKSLIDKAKTELASGKVSKQTYKELRLAVNELRDQDSKSSRNLQEPASKEIIEKLPVKDESYSGIFKLKQDIEKAGGPEKYFNKFIKPNSEHLKPSYRKPLNTKQLDEKYLEDINNLTPYKEENGLSFYNIPDYKSDDDKKLVTIVAVKNGHIAGYARNYQDGTDKYKSKGIYYDGNDAVVSTDLQKSGIGSKLLTELYNKNPEAIKYPGGLTPAGKAATMSILDKISKMEISNKDATQKEVSSKDQNKPKEPNDYITTEEATKLYSQTMKDLSDYVSKTGDYSSEHYKQLTKNRDKAIQIYNDLRNGKKINKSELPKPISETENASKILKQQIEHAKDTSSFLGKEAILQLRKQGLDSKGKPLTSNLTKSESERLSTNTPKIISELRNNKTVKNLKSELTEFKEYLAEGMTEIEDVDGIVSIPDKIDQINKELSNQTKEFKDTFDLYHKENFLYTDKATFIPGTSIKKDFNTNVYIDKNNNTYSISYEPGMEEKAKEVAFIIGTLPEKLRNITNIMLTTERNPADERWSKAYGTEFHSAATCNSVSKVVVAWEGSNESTDINTLYHEFAHSLDSRRTTNEIASSTEYVEAFSKDGEKFTTEYASSAGKLFNKSNRKLGEDFAESVAAYYKNGDKFQKQFPNKYAFMRELFGDNK